MTCRFVNRAAKREYFTQHGYLRNGVSHFYWPGLQVFDVGLPIPMTECARTSLCVRIRDHDGEPAK